MIKTSKNLIGNPATNSAFKVSVWLSAQPSASVTVTPTSTSSFFTSSGALTFTTLNWANPQSLTITPAAGSNYWFRGDVLTLTPSGGGETEVITKNVIFTENQPTEANARRVMCGKYDYWNTEHNTDVSGAINYLFKGDAPTTEETSIDEGYTGNMHDGATTDLSNLSVCDELTMTELDVDGEDVIRKFYVCETSLTYNDKIVIGHQGNNEPGNTANLGNDALAFGYHYVGAALLFTSNNPPSTNTRLTGTSGAVMRNKFGYDNSMDDFDSSSNIALRHWVSHNIRLVNYLITNYDPSEIIIAGTSGGTFDALFSCAIWSYLFPSITFTCIQNRGGVSPLKSFTNSSNIYNAGYDQTTAARTVYQNSTDEVKEFYTQYLTTSGMIETILNNGGSYQFQTNSGDTSSLDEVYSALLREYLRQRGVDVTNFTIDFDTEVGNNTHQMSSDDSDKIFTLLGDI